MSSELENMRWPYLMGMVTGSFTFMDVMPSSKATLSFGRPAWERPPAPDERAGGLDHEVACPFAWEPGLGDCFMVDSTARSSEGWWSSNAGIRRGMLRACSSEGIDLMSGHDLQVEVGPW